MEKANSEVEGQIQLHSVEIIKPLQAEHFLNTAFGVEQDPLLVLVDQKVINNVIQHANSRFEVIGVLVGQVYTTQKKTWLQVNNAIRGKCLNNTHTAVSLNCDDWEEIDHIVYRNYPDQHILGWYHSHPGFGAFLSADDRFIHRSFFDLDWHIALVVDPFRSDLRLFWWDEGQILGGQYSVFD